MGNMINPLCVLLLFCQTLLHLPIVSTFQLNNILNPNYQQPETIKGDTRLAINRIIRQVGDNSTTKLTDQIIETTTKLIDNSEESTTMYEYEEEDDLPTTIPSINEKKTKIAPEKKRSTKDKLDAFLAGPLIIVGAISLVSLCLFLLYVCKYRSTGSRVDFTTTAA